MEESVQQGLEKYPLYYVIGQNAFFIVYFGVGFAGMLPLQIRGFPVVSVIYALFLVTVLLFVLRKHLCTNCYYYGKRCSTGWGYISALMFRKNSGNYDFGAKLAGITWMLAAVIPIAGITLSLVLSYSLSGLTLLILFTVLTPVNFVIHKKSCNKCKMKLTCQENKKH